MVAPGGGQRNPGGIVLEAPEGDGAISYPLVEYHNQCHSAGQNGTEKV